MFSIYLDDKPLWTPKETDKRLIKPTVKLELNKVGSASFSVLPGHPYYDSFVKMQSIITIRQDNRILLKGRVYGNSEDFRKTKTIEVEGVLGYFNDSIVRSYDFSGSVKDYLKLLIDQHNNQVDDQQKFKLGTVTVTDNNDYIVRSSTENPTTWSEITNKLINNLGGYISIRYEEDGNYIDYLEDFTDVATQGIAFSVNLLDLTSEAKADTLATCIIPYGAKNETTGETVNITSVNGGLDYISDPDAVAKYGRIYEVVTWEDVTLPENLLTKAKTYLSTKVKLSTKFTIKAIDLHLADETIESFKLGDYVSVFSKPHDINEKILLTAYSIDLADPVNSTITLGLEKSSYLADSVKDNTERIDKITTTVGDMVTQSAGDIVTQTQTYINNQITNFKDNLLADLIYPIGSIYMSANAVDPGSLFGGTWERVQGRFLLGADDTYTAGSTGGEAEHTLTVDEMPAHEGHLYSNFDNSGYADRGGDDNSYYVQSSASGYAKYADRPYKVVSGNELVMQGYTRGGGLAHNNIPPYLAVYIWKRTS